MKVVSPRSRARIAGLFYLLTFLTAIPAMVSGKLIVTGDAAATATNILTHQPLFLLGFSAYLSNVVVYIVVTQLFYDLFKPVSRSLSMLAAFFSLVACAIQAVISIFYLAPLAILGDSKYMSVFNVEQLHALVLMFLRLHRQAYNIGLPFFGFYCLLIGYLVFRSTFLPRVIGVLMAFAGLAWVTFLWPPLAAYLSPYNLAVGILGEGSLTIWLLVKGLNVQRWNDQGANY